jgi:hypothetical protein
MKQTAATGCSGSSDGLSIAAVVGIFIAAVLGMCVLFPPA